MERLIGIISLALGLLGGADIVVNVFFKTDESRQIVISPRKKLLLVICLVGICLGIALLIYGMKDSKPAIKYNEDWSVERLVQENYDAILQKKDEYQADDAIRSEGRYLNLQVSENAGNMYTYSGDTKEIACELLSGKNLPDVQVILLDYEDNYVIASYRTGESGSIVHYAQKGDWYYCAVVTAEYELYVSPPIFVIGTEEDELYEFIHAFLKKSDDAYSSPHFVRINARDLTQSEQGYSVLSLCSVEFRCIEKDCVDHESFESVFYGVRTNESGFLSYGGEDRICFELNDRYELDIALRLKDASTNMMSDFYDGVYITVEELSDSSNVIDVSFDYDGEKWTLYQWSQ